MMTHPMSSGAVGRSLCDQIVDFLSGTPHSETLRIAQEVCPEMFHLPSLDRQIYYHWLIAQLERMAGKGTIVAHRKDGALIDWTISRRRRLGRKTPTTKKLQGAGLKTRPEI